MEEALVRIRRLVLIGIGIVFLQVLIGAATVSIGMIYREYDRAGASEMMEIIRQSDPHFYTLLNNPQDPTYLEEFTRINTRKINPIIVTSGIILMAMSIFSFIPFVAVYKVAAKKAVDTKEDQSEEGSGGKKEEVRKEDTAKLERKPRPVGDEKPENTNKEKKPPAK